MTNDEIFENLSDEEKDLIKECSKSNYRQIERLPVPFHFSLKTNEREFVSDQSQRQIEKWEGILNKLVDLKILNTNVSQKMLFSLTDLGSKIADKVDR